MKLEPYFYSYQNYKPIIVHVGRIYDGKNNNIEIELISII